VTNPSGTWPDDPLDDDTNHPNGGSYPNSGSYDANFDESTDSRFDDPLDGPFDSDDPDFSDDDDGGVSRGYAAANVDRAPICRYCGVTALPAHRSNVIDTPFVCDNEDCEAFGEAVYL
jgi:hypothetical protein